MTTGILFQDQTLLITGATGSLGRKIIQHLLHFDFRKIIVYSRDEYKQYQLQQFEFFDSRIQYVIGDVRDLSRLIQIMEGVDIVIHCAAMKQIPTCEANPEECFKTNVDGTKNVIHAIKNSQVKKALFISSDKAVDPVSVYGNSKQAGERLFLHANSEKQWFSVIRLGNLLGSSASVIPLFYFQHQHNKPLTVTHSMMTRFFGSLHEGAENILWALENMRGGEIIIPKFQSFKIVDIANFISNNNVIFTGIRPHEKLHEPLVAETEMSHLIENERVYIVTKYKIALSDAHDWYSAKVSEKKFAELSSEKTNEFDPVILHGFIAEQV